MPNTVDALASASLMLTGREGGQILNQVFSQLTT